MVRHSVYFSLILSICLLNSCDVDSTGRRESHPEKDLLKNYVNEPRDRANAAAEKVENRQADIEQQLGEINGDDDGSDED